MEDISITVDSVLTEWSSLKPVVALMGEFSAGKSTLVNLLLGRPLMQTQVTATQLPAVWMTYGDSDGMQGLRRDGTLETLNAADLDDGVRERYLLIRQTSRDKILEKLDIIDAPGISDPRLAKGATEYLGPHIDGVLWCSSATQAWRQSEKKAWSQFPAHLRQSSAIMLTRKDKLRRPSDVTKVTKRVTRETADLFGQVIAIDTVKSIELATNPERSEADWKTAGGYDLFNFLEEFVSSCSKEKGEREITSISENDEKHTDTATSNTEANLQPDLDIMQQLRLIKPKADEVCTYGDVITLFEQLKDKISSDKALSPTQRFVLNQCLYVGQDKNVNVERLFRQVELEIVDFKADNWCTLSSDMI